LSFSLFVLKSFSDLGTCHFIFLICSFALCYIEIRFNNLFWFIFINLSWCPKKNLDNGLMLLQKKKKLVLLLLINWKCGRNQFWWWQKNMRMFCYIYIVIKLLLKNFSLQDFFIFIFDLFNLKILYFDLILHLVHI
jgi:hypothetical protein